MPYSLYLALLSKGSESPGGGGLNRENTVCEMSVFNMKFFMISVKYIHMLIPLVGQNHYLEVVPDFPAWEHSKLHAVSGLMSF